MHHGFVSGVVVWVRVFLGKQTWAAPRRSAVSVSRVISAASRATSAADWAASCSACAWRPRPPSDAQSPVEGAGGCKLQRCSCVSACAHFQTPAIIKPCNYTPPPLHHITQATATSLPPQPPSAALVPLLPPDGARGDFPGPGPASVGRWSAGNE